MYASVFSVVFCCCCPLHKCFYIIMLENNTTTISVVINGHTSYHEGKYYETCADCLLSEDTTLLPDGNSRGRYLFLFSKSDPDLHYVLCYSWTTLPLCSFKARTGKLEPSELETFKKQAECLQFPPEYFFGSTGK